MSECRKVSISIPDDLLEQLDSLAERMQMNRSQAIAWYLRCGLDPDGTWAAWVLMGVAMRDQQALKFAGVS